MQVRSNLHFLYINPRSRGLLALLVLRYEIEASVLNELRASLVIVKSHASAAALLPHIKHPFVSADSRIASRLSADRHRAYSLRQIFCEVDTFKKRLANDHFIFYRQTQIYRYAVICHFLILSRYCNSNVRIILLKIIRRTSIEAIDTLRYDEELAIRALLYHFPYLSAPRVRLLYEKIGRKAGVKRRSRRIFVLPCSVFNDREPEGRYVFRYLA